MVEIIDIVKCERHIIGNSHSTKSPPKPTTHNRLIEGPS
jgi:hypothetical protein